jgi:hypothetical protein
MFIRNCWYVAAWDIEVPAEGLLHRTLLNEPVLLYRDTQGRVVALEDRCCHRARTAAHGPPGRRLRALHVPRHEVRRQRRLRRDSRPGTDSAKACMQAATRWSSATGWSGSGWATRARQPRRHRRFLLARLARVAHEARLHPLPGQLQADRRQPAGLQPPGLRAPHHAGHAERGRTQARDRARHHWHWHAHHQPLVPQRRHAQPAQAAWPSFEGKVDRWQVYQWSPPALLRMDTGSAPTGTGAPEGTRVPEALQFRHTSIQTPETETTSHYWFCQARNFELDNAAMTEQIFADVVVAFEEDRTHDRRRSRRSDPAARPAHDPDRCRRRPEPGTLAAGPHGQGRERRWDCAMSAASK